MRRNSELLSRWISNSRGGSLNSFDRKTPRRLLVGWPIPDQRSVAEVCWFARRGLRSRRATERPSSAVNSGSSRIDRSGLTRAIVWARSMELAASPIRVPNTHSPVWSTHSRPRGSPPSTTLEGSPRVSKTSFRCSASNGSSVDGSCAVVRTKPYMAKPSSITLSGTAVFVHSGPSLTGPIFSRYAREVGGSRIQRILNLAGADVPLRSPSRTSWLDQSRMKRRHEPRRDWPTLMLCLDGAGGAPPASSSSDRKSR